METSIASIQASVSKETVSLIGITLRPAILNISRRLDLTWSILLSLPLTIVLPKPARQLTLLEHYLYSRHIVRVPFAFQKYRVGLNIITCLKILALGRTLSQGKRIVYSDPVFKNHKPKNYPVNAPHLCVYGQQGVI